MSIEHRRPMIVNPKEIGSRIKLTRVKAALTQEALGDLVGLHQSEICRIEKGERDLRIHHLRCIAEALGVDPVKLLEPQTTGEAA